MQYRLAEENDMEEIKEILVKSFNPTYAYYAEKSFVQLDKVIVAEHEGGLAGIINWRLFKINGQWIGYLFWLAVKPGYRRLGIAKELIFNGVERIRQEAGPIEIYAAVEKNNIPSQNLIECLGFIFISRSEMKKRYGIKRIWLFLQMMLLSKEDLYHSTVQDILKNRGRE